MASQVTPKKNTAFSFTTAMVDAADTTIFKSSPTLAAGDVKVFKDFGASANITSLPTSDGKAVEVSLSATEMNADRIVVIFSDVSGAEWCDQIVEIHTSANQIDDLSTLTTAQVNAEADTALSDYDPPTKAELDSGLAGLNDITVAQILAATVSGTYTVNDSLHTILIGFLGKTTGSTTSAPKFRTLADDGDAITYTVDASGNRTAVSDTL